VPLIFESIMILNSQRMLIAAGLEVWPPGKLPIEYKTNTNPDEIVVLNK
jgi:hypothetical protein